MKFKMYHSCITVLNLEKSIEFYKKAFGLEEVKRKEGEGFRIVWVGNDTTEFTLELTEFTGRTEPYNLGENEVHLGFHVEDYDAAHRLHEEMGCICFENPAMGIYFVADPDGYWMEVVPA